MLLSTVILGWIGILLFLFIATTFNKLAKNNEFGFLHLLMAVMYVMWLPIPIAMTHLLNNEALQVGMIFGIIYLSMMIITMALQTGHIVHIEREVNKSTTQEERSNHMMATLSGPFELLANILKCIWALFLTIAFWENNNFLLAIIMSLFCLLIVYFLAILVDISLLKRIKFFGRFKPNPYFFNIETFCFFLILMSFISIHL
ncbi:hypothetical protein ACQKL5_03655 [Peribacillus sp. NPDC097675]|uniref:hypothetical protein n=1 Tax=Peribacillus sp. NPDC097675 TaxID=3390618 RepID=UPI003D08AF47